jgi:hypothetical protein
MSKLFVMLSLALAGSVAGAVVRGPGEVKAAYCGEVRENEIRMGGFTMVKICTASIAGLGGKYLEVVESRATRRGGNSQATIWQITSEQPARNGVVVSVNQVGYSRNGVFVKVVNVRASTGKVLIEKSRTGAPVKMSGELDGRKFKAGNFRGVIRAL